MVLNSGGVVGFAGRYPLPSQARPRAADLVLAGRPLPLTGALRIYTCGITPYDVTHLGHAATFVWADLLVRVARALEVKTVSCRNVTDIDDVLTHAAEQRHRHYDELAVTQEFLFDRDMRDLSVDRPDLVPHARGHVPQVIGLVESLLALGRAYEVEGTVYFDARPGEAGGLDLAGLTDQAALAGLAEFGDTPGGGDAGDVRRSPYDVPVWKPSPEDHPAWPSPWGWGRPAWHVECAAMAATAFGPSLDVLVGGADLAFPHHAYQAAMVQAASGVSPFARVRMHVGTVHFAGAKMAKSTGNLVLVRDLLAEQPGAVLRLLLLDRAWHAPWEYQEALLTTAAERLAALHAAAGRLGSGSRDHVLAALVQDLDVPAALDLAIEQGGESARALIDLLRL